LYEIVYKKDLNPTVCLMDIKAPFIANKAKAGQFIILRVNEQGERIPLTVAATDKDKGTVTIIFQKVGKTTIELGELKTGECLQDFVGPLGRASEFEGMKHVAVIGGGVGCAIAYPQAKALHDLGAEVDLITGFRDKDLVILEDEMRAASTNLFICTDDGSYVEKALVTDVLKRRIDQGDQIRSRYRYRSADNDEVRSETHKRIQYPDYCFNEPDNDRRYGNVRRMPCDCRRRDEICLCRRP
jgi:ferredoxin--NADP+ reductase